MFNFLAGDLSSLNPAPFFPNGSQIIKWDWFTIAYLVIIAISIAVGIKRGLLYSILTVISGVVAIIIGFLIAKPVGGWASNIWGAGLTGKVEAWLSGKLGESASTLAIDPTAEGAAGDVGLVLNSLGIPTIICSVIGKLIVKLAGSDMITVSSM